MEWGCAMNDPYAVLLHALSALIGLEIGQRKGRSAWNAMLGCFYGLTMGPLGLIYAALTIDGRPQCTECGGRVEKWARLCPHCRTPQR